MRDEGDAFVNLLLAAAAQREHDIYVVLTMRTDFLGHCVRYLDLPDAINRAQYLTPRLSRPEIERFFSVVGAGSTNVMMAFMTLKERGKRGVDPELGHEPSQQELMGILRKGLKDRIKAKGAEVETLAAEKAEKDDELEKVASQAAERCSALDAQARDIAASAAHGYGYLGVSGAALGIVWGLPFGWLAMLFDTRVRRMNGRLLKAARAEAEDW